MNTTAMNAAPPKRDRTGCRAAARRRDGPAPAPNFLRAIVADDNRTGKYGGRVVTRFPPEPNGYLHYGHAKSIILNFGLAAENGGTCHLRFDDTNPLKEDVEYEDVDRGVGALARLRLGRRTATTPPTTTTTLYAFAEWFIEQGLAYVDSQSAEEMRATRGTLTEPGIDSPYRSRSVAENLDLFRRDARGRVSRRRARAAPEDRHGEPERQPARPGDLSHPPRARTTAPATSGASIRCTTTRTASRTRSSASRTRSARSSSRTTGRCTTGSSRSSPRAACSTRPLPQQYEFARLNLTYVVLSQAQADPARRGADTSTAGTIRACRRSSARGGAASRRRDSGCFAERIGVSKADSWIDMSVLEECMRDDLNARAQRRIAVLDPVRLVIDNYPEGAERGLRRARTIRSSPSSAGAPLPF